MLTISMMMILMLCSILYPPPLVPPLAVSSLSGWKAAQANFLGKSAIKIRFGRETCEDS